MKNNRTGAHRAPQKNDDIMANTMANAVRRYDGISLISLIITIIVIIILAAIVIFNGLNAPNSAQFASFVQQVDNVQMAVMNKHGELKTKHSISGHYRTDEQIYIEIAVAHDPEQYASMGTLTVNNDNTGSSIGESTGIQNIVPATSSDKTNDSSLGMTLPKVRESNNGWYVTANGRVFNANGYVYDGKTYFTGSVYQAGELPANATLNSNRAAYVYEAIKQDISEVTGAPEVGTGEVVIPATTTPGATAPATTGGASTPTPTPTPTPVALTIGDERTINGQKFIYIGEGTGTEAGYSKYLAKYNVDTSNNVQATDNTVYPVAFDSSTSTYANANIKNLVDSYVGTLSGVASGRLLLREDLNALNGGTTVDSEELSGTSLPKWIYRNDADTANRAGYWLGSPNWSDSARLVDSGGLYTGNVSFSSGIGVRPVILISGS